MQDPRRDAYGRVKAYLDHGPVHREVLSSEGQFVMVFNDELVPFVTRRLTGADLDQLDELLTDTLRVELTDQSFAKAAERLLEPGELDDTNYDAIWVRDTGWIYFACMRRGHRDQAREILLAIWDYYATAHQRRRFERCIADPSLALTGTMDVPHVRFDGASPHLDDVFVDGEPEIWNHRQNDAHGIFLAALADAVAENLVESGDFSTARAEAIALIPSYFDAIAYHRYPGAGAWEEVNKVNVSSIAMVVRGLESWERVLADRGDLAERVGHDPIALRRLIANGYETIHTGLYQGGEATTRHDPYDVEFRRSDAALFNLFLPTPLAQLELPEKRLGTAILEKLIRPFGVIRYHNDSYQGGNYWIRSGHGPADDDGPTATGDSSSRAAFLARFKRLRPHTEAQWFFDSKLAMIHVQLMREEADERTRRIDRFLAEWHFKRALGQVTGNGHDGLILAADGKPVAPYAVPESINTVIVDGRPGYLPSPITPLNWAKASLAMALEDLRDALDG